MSGFCTDGLHEELVQDKFAKLPGVRRNIPGDCYCLGCKSPIAAYWNNGNPVPVEIRNEP